MRLLYAIGLLLPALRKSRRGEVAQPAGFVAQKEKLEELLLETRGLRDAVRRTTSPGDAVGSAGREAGRCTGT